MKKTHIDIGARNVEIDVRQWQIAESLGYDDSHFSRILRGRVDTPDGFEDRVNAALDKLARAEEAVQEAS